MGVALSVFLSISLLVGFCSLALYFYYVVWLRPEIKDSREAEKARYQRAPAFFLLWKYPRDEEDRIDSKEGSTKRTTLRAQLCYNSLPPIFRSGEKSMVLWYAFLTFLLLFFPEWSSLQEIQSAMWNPLLLKVDDLIKTENAPTWFDCDSTNQKAVRIELESSSSHGDLICYWMFYLSYVSVVADSSFSFEGGTEWLTIILLLSLLFCCFPGPYFLLGCASKN